MDDTGPAQRQVILTAALNELLLRGIDDFTVERVADRAGVNPAVITREWGDRRVLLMDAMFSEGHQGLPVPDTGSLRGDVEAVAAMLAALNAAPKWRSWFQRLLPASRDADFTEIRTDFIRGRMAEFVPVLQRAAERGELREGIDLQAAIRMFYTAYNADLIFDGTGVLPEYGTAVLDIFRRGITRD